MQHEMSRSQAEIDLITTEKAKRVAIFDETRRFFAQNGVGHMRRVSERNFVRWQAEANDRRQHMLPGAAKKGGIYCEETDGLRVASLLTQLYGQKVAVLNFANANCFGGGVRGGAGAQEENMFRRTDCYCSKKPNETDQHDMYVPAHTELLNARHGRVYLDTDQHRVCVRDQEEELQGDLGYRFLAQSEIFPFIELRAAAKDLRRRTNYMSDAVFEVDCRRRVKAQFETLLAKKVRHVVLGAFGCGAFENNPVIVARVYMQAVVQYAQHFDVVAFAIVKSRDNLAAFRHAAQVSGIVLQSLAHDLQTHQLGHLVQSLRYNVRPAKLAPGIGVGGAAGGALSHRSRQTPNSEHDQHRGPTKSPWSPARARGGGGGGGGGGRDSEGSGSAAAGGGRGAAGGGSAAAGGGSAAAGGGSSTGWQGGEITQPLQYMSILQHSIILGSTSRALAQYAPQLPCWIPSALLAEAYGHSTQSVDRAQASLRGRPYLWATEFENKHRTWVFHEPSIVVDGRTYANSEVYFQSQKPVPYNDKVWKKIRVQVMQKAVHAKFTQHPALKDLLISTHPHALLSIKNDDFWGFHPEHGGNNMLGHLLENLRDKCVSEAHRITQGGK